MAWRALSTLVLAAAAGAAPAPSSRGPLFVSASVVSSASLRADAPAEVAAAGPTATRVPGGTLFVTPVAVTTRTRGAAPAAALELRAVESPTVNAAQARPPAASSLEVRYSPGLGGAWATRDHGRPLSASGAPVLLESRGEAGGTAELALFVPDALAAPAGDPAPTAYVVVTVMADAARR